MGYYDVAELLMAAANASSSSSGSAEKTGRYVCKDSFPTEDIVLGILLGIGIFISFLPQILVLIIRKNIEGLSLISCWFNYVNCMATFLNVLFLNWFVFACCHDYMTSWVCFQNLVPVAQLGVPFVTTGLIFALYVIYRPFLPPFAAVEEARRQQKLRLLEQQQKDDLEKSGATSTSLSKQDTAAPDSKELPFVEPVASTDSHSSSAPAVSSSATNEQERSQAEGDTEDGDKKKKKKKKRVAGEIPPDSFLLKEGNNKIERFFIRMDWYSLPFFWGSMAASVIFFFIGLGLALGYGAKSDQLYGYAYAMGILAAVLVFLQWLPQIYTTWISDQIGSLSLISLCIQIPGALLICYNQLSLNQSWTTWFPYLATAIQEIVLLGICIYYLIRDRKKRKREEREKKMREEQQQQQEQQKDGESFGTPTDATNTYGPNAPLEDIKIDTSSDNNNNNNNNSIFSSDTTSTKDDSASSDENSQALLQQVPDPEATSQATNRDSETVELDTLRKDN